MSYQINSSSFAELLQKVLIINPLSLALRASLQFLPPLEFIGHPLLLKLPDLRKIYPRKLESPGRHLLGLQNPLVDTSREDFPHKRDLYNSSLLALLLSRGSALLGKMIIGQQIQVRELMYSRTWPLLTSGPYSSLPTFLA